MLKTLFPLPTPKRIGSTRPRLKMLDLIESFDGQPLPPRTASRQVLRRLLADKLIVITKLGPAVYRLTPVGRMVRSRSRHPGGRDEV